MAPAPKFLLSFVLLGLTDSFVQGQLTAGCTTNSFTIPSWLIQDFQAVSSANTTAVSFQTQNRATNASAELRCRFGGSNSTSEACTVRGSTLPLFASLQLEKTYARFALNETWSCSDLTPAKPITFTAVGDGALSINCTADASFGTETCKPTSRAPLLIKSALLSPVEINPTYVAGPVGHDTQGCSVNSSTPSWEVGASQLNLRTNNGKVQGGTGFIQIKNNILGYIATCNGNFATGSGFYLLQCSAQSISRPREKYHIQTVPEFNPETFTLSVNETWYLAITAHARSKLPITCEAFSDTTTFCTGDPHTFTGRLVSSFPLPPYSLKDPLPTAESCTISSVVSPSWWFSDLVTTTSGTGTGSVKFGIELATGNSSFTGFPSVIARGGVPIKLLMGGAQALEPVWYPCVFESIGELNLTPTACAFKYDSAERVLRLSADWKCGDLDAAHPVLFSGEVRWNVPELNCTTSGSRTTCATPQGKAWLATGTSSLYGVRR
ncbi:hypothetical protein QBC38DRAFT_513881 [Podospora fimiseda]|uniref:Ig-like domain-containing protein n=1 Tax=Podospora fimiseda TaxID=252190 RepID=A0AAN6YLW1_9PEZI|nr:hypothetical protein QBC38DRAFT_513881 [Podospora fimiseda]